MHEKNVRVPHSTKAINNGASNSTFLLSETWCDAIVGDAMATKVEVVSRCVERLLPLVKDRAGLKGLVLEAQKWCGTCTTDNLTNKDVAIVTAPFLAAAVEPKEETIATCGLDALDKLLGHAVINAAMSAPPGILPPLPNKPAAVVNGTPAPTPNAADLRRHNDGAADAAGDGTTTLLELIVDVVSSRATSASEEIVINVIRTLLTAVAACDAKGPCLANAVDTMITVLLQTRGSKHTQQTGKASLSQIAGIVQRRTELARPTEEDQEPPEWIDCVALLQRFIQLIDGEGPKVLLGLTLLHNFVMTLDPGSVIHSPSAIEALRRTLTSKLVPLLVSTTPAISKPAFYLAQHLLENFRFILRHELPPLMNFIYAIAERSSNYALRSLAYNSMFSFAKHPEFLFDLFRNYDCVTGSHDVFSQFCAKVELLAGFPGAITFGTSQDETLRLTALSSVNAIAHSIRKFYDGHSNGEPTPMNGSFALNTSRPFSLSRVYCSPKDPFGDHVTFDQLAKQLENKRRYMSVLKKFSDKPKDGIQAAVQEGMAASTSPADVAKFLRLRGIDKMKVGEYLSANKPEIAATVKEFIGLNDFTGQTIDEAIRLMLGFFKIGGEAETIDRTMQVFTKQYLEQNPGSFGDSDTPYVLAFSIMMLNTDQHSPNVRDKMTKDQFISTNRGINNGGDLPRDLLEGIYHRIRTNEIRLNDDTITLDDDVVIKAIAPPVKKDGPTLWNPQPCVDKTIERLTNLIPFEPLRPAHDPQLAVALFSAAWSHAHLALTNPLDEPALPPKIVAKCFDGIDRYVSVACLVGNANARRTLIAALRAASKLVKVGGHQSEVLHPKHVKCVELLVRMATRDGNELGDSWGDVLMCVSKSVAIINRLKTQSAKPNAKLNRNDATTLDALTNGLDVTAIDAMFAVVPSLNDDALMAVIDGLLSTAQAEFRESQPRTSAFVQLVELIGKSLRRSSPVVTALWTTLSTTVADIAVRLPRVAESAFKILNKFFEGLQNELPAAHAEEPANESAITTSSVLVWEQRQAEALDVLWRAAWQTRDSTVRGYILTTVTGILTRGATTLSTGWEPLLKTVGLLACDADSRIVTRAFFTLTPCLVHAHNFNMGAFNATVAAASAFAASGNKDVDDTAIDIVEVCAAIARYGAPAVEDVSLMKQLEDGDYNGFVVSLGTNREARPLQCASLDVWNTIVANLTSGVTSSSTHHKVKCITSLFRILSTYPEVWSACSNNWEAPLAEGIAPIFDHLFFAIDDAAVPRQIEELVGVLQRALAFMSSLFLDQEPLIGCFRGFFLQVIARCLNHRLSSVADVGLGHVREWVTSSASIAVAFGNDDWLKVGTWLADTVKAPALIAPAPPLVARALQALELLTLAASSRSLLLDGYENVFLPALSEAFTFCSEAKITRDSQTYAGLLMYQSQCATTALQIITVRGRTSHLIAWSRVIIAEYIAAVERGNQNRESSVNAQQCAKALTDAVCELLSSHHSVDDASLSQFMDPLAMELCDLIRCCEPRILAPLSMLFKRHMSRSAA
jgi:hypothetical protein